MSEQNKELMNRWFEEVWNKGRVEAVDEMLAEDCLAHGLGSVPLVGPAGFRTVVEKFRGAFPDIQIVVEDAVTEGDRVAVRTSVRGTHLGDHLGIAATGKPIDFTGMVFVRIKNGRIAEGWNNYDFQGMFAQIAP